MDRVGTPAGAPFVRATAALTKRWLWRLKRESAGLAAALIQPALWLVLFGHLFEKGNVVTEHSYIAFMTAGVIVMTVFNAALSGGVEILFDRETEMLQRLVALPIPPAAIFTSRFVFTIGLAASQALVILLTALVLGVGITSGLPGLVLILVTGVLLGIGITAISVALALALRGHGQFFSITGFISLPLIFTSNALAPLEMMPSWLQWLARLNPMTYAIGNVRKLILEGIDWPLLASMSGIIILFDIAMVGVCLWAMRRVLD
jgi:ABC-2 type transport system permease protein